MAVTVRIPEVLWPLTRGSAEILVDAGTVDELVLRMDESFAGIRARFCTEDGSLRRNLNVFVNNVDIRALDGASTRLRNGDVVRIIPSIAGGAHVERKVYLTFRQELIKEPLIFRVGHEFRIVTNIRGASVSDEIGLVALEISGEEEEVVKAIAWLREKGVKVEPIEQDFAEP